MSLREVSASGFESLMLATQLLQRARLADPVAGLWEAADVQWCWRTPRRSDDAEKLFWIDDDGPVAGILLTSWTDDVWQCDPLMVPRASGVDPGVVWRRAMEHAARYAVIGFDVPVGDNDRAFRELARQSGLTAGYQDSTAWMDGANRPEVMAVPNGFVLVDRTQRGDAPHPMRQRSGENVAQRLEQLSLYDPALDLAVESGDGRVAGYSLYWFDPTTMVGLVEPVRVEDEFQRQGIAKAMLTAGIARLVARGAQRVKISYDTDAAAALYKSVGFRRTSTATWYRAQSG